MIPVRVLLKNFLCYTETDEGRPIEFNFEGSSLWSISGDNGAGKSAIFDAITYALFGRHRGGAQRDSQLIRKGALGCEITFEFCLDDQFFKIDRTIRRPRGKSRLDAKTRKASWFDQRIQEWRPVPETERETALSHWVQKKLGFGFETFVSSVMLRQGESDQMISAKPRDRFEILSGLLDLESYKRLETLAVNQKRQADAEAKSYEARLRQLATVTRSEVDTARDEYEKRNQIFEKAKATANHTRGLVNASAHYARLQTELLERQKALRAKATLLQDAELIRAEYQEWQHLSVSLPKLRSAINDLKDGEQKTKQAEQKKVQVDAIDENALKQAFIEAGKVKKRYEEKCDKLRLECDALTTTMPFLRDILKYRKEKEDRAQTLIGLNTSKHWRAETERLQKDLDAQRREQEAVEDEKEQALQTKAQAQAAVRQAHTQITARTAAQSEAVCSRCGQSITSEHIQQELADAKQAFNIAQKEERAAIQNFKGMERKAKDIFPRIETITRHLDDANQACIKSGHAEKNLEEVTQAFQNAIDAAKESTRQELTPFTTGSLEDAEEALQKFEKHLDGAKQTLRQTEEDLKQSRLCHEDTEQVYQGALHQRNELLSDIRHLKEIAREREKHAEELFLDVLPDWRERAKAMDDFFINTLTQRQASLKGIEQKHTALQQAEAEHQKLEIECETIEGNIERIPSEHRLSEEKAKALDEEAQERLKDNQDNRDKALQEFRSLEDRRKEQKKVEKEAAETQQRRRLYTKLAHLLGRNGLQSYLLNEAIRGIEQLANETLSSISNGQLHLRIEKAPSNKGEEEITIQVVDLSSTVEPLDAQFVSGSQKFRVSVSLAAGIGQYAGRGVGSVRSLIIDEGFGSLDIQGRQEMIDELRNLSQFIERIIIVSHQEDFQDRTVFPTGYLLHKTDHGTQVERCV